jgi:hypothetical protein
MAEDDPSIVADVRLYRRVHPNFILEDKTRGCLRLATGAFQDEEMSVAFGDTLAKQGNDPATIFDAYVADGYCVVCFAVAAVRAAELGICRDPKHDDPAHGLVLGKKTGGKQRQLARACVWTVAPRDGCEPPYV